MNTKTMNTTNFLAIMMVSLFLNSCSFDYSGSGEPKSETRYKTSNETHWTTAIESDGTKTRYGVKSYEFESGKVGGFYRYFHYPPDRVEHSLSVHNNKADKITVEGVVSMVSGTKFIDLMQPGAFSVSVYPGQIQKVIFQKSPHVIPSHSVYIDYKVK